MQRTAGAELILCANTHNEDMAEWGNQYAKSLYGDKCRGRILYVEDFKMLKLSHF